ncbi:hypothetical protein Sjap_009431 [Stephania japonica]|uniref:WAT1-related protein n=1 Tax=Stephania japonica TaxID=461633 RepID=A0AAP0JRF6_9MAGN
MGISQYWQIERRDHPIKMELSDCLKRNADTMAPFLLMFLAEIIAAINSVVSKVVFTSGTDPIVFNVYQFIVSLLFLAPFAFFLERKSRPPLTFSILCWLFLQALLGATLFMNLYAASLNYISSTSQSAMINLFPAFTYVLSVASRQEQAELNQLRGIGKLLGTIVSVSGAFTLILCRRKSVTSMIFASDFSQDVGYAMIVFGTLSFSAWIVLQKPMMERYPAGLSITAIMYLFGTLQTCLIVVFTSYEASKWKLNWDLELLNIVIGGILNGGVAMFIFTWCAKKRGPLFVAVFSPLNLLLTAVIEMVILGTTMNFGGLFGAVMIVGGLYLFLWSKSKEETKDAEADDEIFSPFLPQSTYC